MANTKNITDRSERKAAKRGQRKALKETFQSLSFADRKRFHKSETTGLCAWIAEQASDD